MSLNQYNYGLAPEPDHTDAEIEEAGRDLFGRLFEDNLGEIEELVWKGLENEAMARILEIKETAEERAQESLTEAKRDRYGDSGVA